MHKQSKYWLGNIILISLFLLAILSACAPTTATKTGVNTLQVVLGALLLVGLIGAIFYLYKLGKLQSWASQGVGLGKSKYQATRLGSEKKKIDKSRSLLVDELGSKVWEEKIENPAYAEDWNRLKAMENQQEPIVNDVHRLESEAQRVKEQRDNLSDQLNRQISGLQAQIQNLTARLSVLKGSQATAEKNYQSLQQRSNSLIAEIRNLQTRVTQTQASNAPDRDQQIFAMNNSIATHNNEILSISNQVPVVQSELTRLRNEQSPLSVDLDKVKTELFGAQDQLKQAIPPLDAQFNNLNATIKSKQNEISSIKTMMQPLIIELGPLAEQARPDSPVLNDLYSKIDVEKSKLGSVTSEVDLTLSRIEATDKNSARNFYLVVAGAVVVLVVAIWLIVTAL